MGRVYCVTCLINGKMYIGITSRTVRHRWSQHVNAARRGEDHQVLLRGIRKHGEKQFEVEELFAYPTRAEASEAEVALIEALNLRDRRHGYNVTIGGDLSPMHGRSHKASSKAKMAAAKKGKPLSPEHKEKLRVSNTGRRIWSAEQRAAISARKMGQKHTLESRAKMSASQTGNRHTEETKLKIGEASRLRPRAQSTRDAQRASVKKNWDSMSPKQRAERGKMVSIGRALARQRRNNII